jgi:hypothetical protein
MMTGGLVAIGIVVVIGAVYATNVGQFVHGTDSPTWLERLGRR